MKTTLVLPDDLMQEVKLRALEQDRSIKDLIADFIRMGLRHPLALHEQTPATDRFLKTNAQGLPVIRCEGPAPATQATVQELLDLEQQALLNDDLRHAGHPV